MVHPSSRLRLLERYRQLLDSRPDVPAIDRERFRDLALAILKSMEIGVLERMPEEEVLAVIEETMRFVSSRRADEVRVRVIPGAPAVLETCMRDQPFIYDTVRLLLDEEGIAVGDGFHAVVGIARDDAGRLTGVGAPGMPLESVIHLELGGVDTDERAAELGRAVAARLAFARVAVRDFEKMTAALQEIMGRYEELARKRPEEQAELLEARRFLGWLLERHFVFLSVGYLAAGEAQPPRFGGGLGTSELDPITFDALDRALARGEGAPYVRVRNSPKQSRIQRRGRLDHVLARWFDARGRPGGLVVFEGLFTYRARSRPAAEIPMLEPILARLLEEAALPPEAYRTRMMHYAFSVLPVEFLFMAPREDVGAVVERILASAEGRTTELALSVDSAHGAAYVFVAMPKAEYDEELRLAIAELLQRRFGAPVTDSDVSLGVLETAVLHFFLSGTDLVGPDPEALREEVVQLVAPWRERLRIALERRFGEARAEGLLLRYEEAFPEDYRRAVSPSRTVADIEHLEMLLAGKSMAFDLFREEVGGKLGDPLLRIYEREDRFLSDLLPVLTRFGLVVSSQYETKVHPRGERELSIDTFRIGGVAGVPGADVMAARERFLEGLEAVFAGRFTDRPLNALLLRTEMTWREVGLMRSYLAYAQQLGFRFTPNQVRDVLLQYAQMVPGLARIFRIKFDPALVEDGAERARRLEEARQDFLERLQTISDYAADRILRSLLNLIDATVRTNLYLRGGTADNLALKFRCADVDLMAPPRPLYEIFVHHVDVEGVHLRGGKVARGGIRWSDRVDDYRTEILGLMRTQMVKNSIIVPVGAKGGFILHRPADDPKTRRVQADAAYRLFVSALLDVTDNLKDGKVVRPADLLVYDEDDPYLVVAADKGTAHLSDTANELAKERGFWLNDAFASGGSHGYDHKATGITARGAWVCAKRHLRELGLDPERAPITVVGIGDMSGDVFGNGLLMSRNFKLMAAFDHRHIFLDPDPDPERSFAERERLFRLPGSSWNDYDRSVISRGGGVFPREAKEIPLSPELQKRFGLTVPALSGEEMIRAILTLDVDLLWNGGIGTYIKASTEDHREVGDRTNDPVRVDARDVRARVIAEGGNLGVTMAGRIEYAARGGRVNLDAIDNSGGVDLSDHEVNLKILVEPSCRAGRLSYAERDRLLVEAEQEVIERVLTNNESQSRMLSMEERRSRRDAPRFARAIRFLSRAVPFDVGALHLPDLRTLRARAQNGEGVLRPELAVLAGYGKIYVKRQLLTEGELDPRSPHLWPMLLGYFPRVIAERFRSEVAEHLLAREIGITMLTNRLVDDAGLTFFPELEAWSGRTTSEVGAAYLAAESAAGARELKKGILLKECDLASDGACRALLRVEDGLEQGAALLLTDLGGGTLDAPPGAAKIMDALPENLPLESALRFEAAVAELKATGLAAPLARRVAAMDYLAFALRAAKSAQRSGQEPAMVFQSLVAAAEASRILDLERRMAALPSEDEADAGALRTLRLRMLGSLAAAILGHPEQVERRVARFSRAVGLTIAESLTVSALVTLDDRLQRIVTA
jgi:glutamate dehydrogenase